MELELLPTTKVPIEGIQEGGKDTRKVSILIFSLQEIMK